MSQNSDTGLCLTEKRAELNADAAFLKAGKILRYFIDRYGSSPLAAERRERASPSLADKMIQSATRAAASSIGRQIGNRILRGVLGGMFRGR